MAEYIVSETAYPLATRQEIVGELIRCKDCKPRLLIPQPERTGRWIDSHTTCSECGWQMIDDVIESPNIVAFNFCPNCGADMRIPVEIARSIVHKVIDNSVWSDTVDTAKMHKVVDDKYAEIMGDANVDAES